MRVVCHEYVNFMKGVAGKVSPCALINGDLSPLINVRIHQALASKKDPLIKRSGEGLDKK